MTSGERPVNILFPRFVWSFFPDSRGFGYRLQRTRYAHIAPQPGPSAIGRPSGVRGKTQ